MRSSRIITLFSERTEDSQSPFAFLASTLVHSAVIGVVAFVILYMPGSNNRVITERYDVRQLELHAPEEPASGSAGSAIPYPGPYPPRDSGGDSGGKQAAPPAAMRQVAKAAPGPQTLVQPDIHTHLALNQEVPLPTVVIWSGKNTPDKTIVTPKPEKPTAADVQPSPDPPNRETNLADVRISSADQAKQTQPLLPSTTSPVVVHGPELPQKVPATASDSPAAPTPAAVMSLSDRRMMEGKVVLPPANVTASSASPGALAPGTAKSPSHAGNGNPASRAVGAGAERGSGDKGDKPGRGKAAATGAGQGSGGAGVKPKLAKAVPKEAQQGSGSKAVKPAPNKAEANLNGAKIWPAQGSGSGSGSGSQSSPDHIRLPVNGQFSSVVVGTSLGQKYPEAAEVWSGRLAYTVYLHVGLAKSWLLQYSLPRSDDAPEAGSIARLEAPWPYNIVRPNIDPDTLNADALLVHGFVNQAGRFEALAIAFPPEFAQARFVLDALAQWQFRPATQNGQNVKVEVLLIIPEESQ